MARVLDLAQRVLGYGTVSDSRSKERKRKNNERFYFILINLLRPKTTDLVTFMAVYCSSTL